MKREKFFWDNIYWPEPQNPQMWFYFAANDTDFSEKPARATGDRGMATIGRAGLVPSGTHEG